jgi:putative ATPase
MDNQSTLFTNQGDQKRFSPLAERLRPSTWADLYGHEKWLGKKGKLSSLIQKDELPSLIIWGPPGTGKTSFAHLVSVQTKAFFVKKNAIDLGSKEIKEIGMAAKDRRLFEMRKTILFVDEVHRLNKAQQDAFLPFVETGDFTLIGATTENPSFELNSALLSRTRLIVFERLDETSLRKLIDKCILELKTFDFLDED